MFRLSTFTIVRKLSWSPIPNPAPVLLKCQWHNKSKQCNDHTFLYIFRNIMILKPKSCLTLITSQFERTFDYQHCVNVLFCCWVGKYICHYPWTCLTQNSKWVTSEVRRVTHVPETMTHKQFFLPIVLYFTWCCCSNRFILIINLIVITIW